MERNSWLLQVGIGYRLREFMWIPITCCVLYGGALTASWHFIRVNLETFAYVAFRLKGNRAYRATQHKAFPITRSCMVVRSVV